MTNDYNLDDIAPTINSGGIVAQKYEGKRVKIAKVEALHIPDKWAKTIDNPTGDYNPNSTVMKWVLRVSTEPLHEVDVNGEFTEKIVTFQQEDGSVKQFIRSHDFSLIEEVDPATNQKKLAYSKHPKAGLNNFMKKLGCTKTSEIINKYVTLTAKPSKKEGDDTMYVEIVI